MEEKKEPKIRSAKWARLESLDKADWKDVLNYCAPSEERCIGERLIVPGYVCLHCGSESPSSRCLETADQMTKPKKKAPASAQAGQEE